MPLVEYSDSSDEDDVSPAVPAKKTSGSSSTAAAADLPPLPTEFHNLYTVAPRISGRDDPSVHGGRVRSTPHVQGNWPTHLFLEWHLSRTEFDIVNSLVTALSDGPVKRYNHQNNLDSPRGDINDEAFKLHSFLVSDLNVQMPLHLSLSRPIILRTEQRSDFMKLLEEKIEGINIRTFSICFTSLIWVPNLDRTRWFLILKAFARRSSTSSAQLFSTSATPPSNSKAPSPYLSNLLRCCNETAEAFGQPGLYITNHNHNQAHQHRQSQTTNFFSISTPTEEENEAKDTMPAEGTIADEGFHVSIGWSLREPPAELQSDIQATAEGGYMARIREELAVDVDTVKAKIGNVVNVIKLVVDRS